MKRKSVQVKPALRGEPFRSAVWHKLLPDCREAVRLQSESLHHKLGFVQRFRLRIHLAVCDWCQRYVGHIGFLRRAVHAGTTYWDEPRGANLSRQARARIGSALQQRLNDPAL